MLHPDLALVALIAATQELGILFAEALIDRLNRTDDTVLRTTIIRALGYQTDRALRERVWALILDPAIPKRDSAELLRRQGHRVANGEAVFDWIVAHYDAVLDAIPRSHGAWLPWRASAICDPAGRDRVEAFFADRAQQHDGGPRVLANVLEAIDICIAVGRAQRQDAGAALDNPGLTAALVPQARLPAESRA